MIAIWIVILIWNLLLFIVLLWFTIICRCKYKFDETAQDFHMFINWQSLQ
jgi:hypothetical protein